MFWYMMVSWEFGIVVGDGWASSIFSISSTDNLCTGLVESNSPFIDGAEAKSVESTMFIAAGKEWDRWYI